MNFIVHRRALISILIFLVAFSFFCQDISGKILQYRGYKYFKNFHYLEYDHHAQNWCFVQDKRGVIYVGNLGGLLVFDGVTWDLVEIPNMMVRSMAIGKDGRIYIGGKDEFGYVTPNPKGFLEYISLRDKLDRQYGNISDLWNTVATEEGIYFRTRNLLFRWNYKSIDMHKKGKFLSLYKCGERLLVQDSNLGLQDVEDTTLIPLPGSTIFRNEKILMLSPFDDDKEPRGFLLGIRSRGLIYYNNGTVTPFYTEADKYLKEKKMSYGVRLSTGDYVIATLYGGIVILDDRGSIKYIFNKSCGLQDNNVKFVMEDSLGNLWLALSKGITRLEYRSPFYHYDDRMGLDGVVLSVTRHKGNLYVGTTQGIFVLRTNSDKFNRIAGIGTCWDLLSTGESLLAATIRGVFHIDTYNGKPGRVFETQTFAMTPSLLFPGYVWCASNQGLTALLHKENRWTTACKYNKITNTIRDVVEDPAGYLWLVSSTGEILKVRFPSNINQPEVVDFKRQARLYEGELHLDVIDGHVVFASRKGLFRYNQLDNKFIPDMLLGKQFAYDPDKQDVKHVFRMAQDRQRNIWLVSQARYYHAAPGPGESFTIQGKPFQRLPIIQTYVVFPDPDGRNIWFGGAEGLVKYDSAVRVKWNKDFPAIIHKVLVNDSIPVFGVYKDSIIEPDSIPIFPFEERDISFQCGALFYEKEAATVYRYKLYGYDDDWTEWTPDSRKHYTNLDSGGYTFRVQAKNIYDVISSEDNFSFKVLPPWYQTWWAFVLYGIGFLAMFHYALKWKSRQTVRDKEKLERVVAERTLQLKEQSEKLKEMDKVKSRFFANISHEFRTPLTLIMSPLEQMWSQSRDKVLRKNYHLMLRNAQQLLMLINRLLELARFDSGRMELHAVRLNIVTLLRSVVTAFQEVAQQRRLSLQFRCEKEDIMLYVDPEKVEQAICNLLSNAVKFTSPGGRITLSAAEESHYFHLSVKDTGIGIPGGQMEHIFDHFFQVGRTKDKIGQGSGIGLSLTKEIISLHNGKIEVHSVEGKGTEFVIRLPLGKDHLKGKEIEANALTAAGYDINKEIAAVYLEAKDGDGIPPGEKGRETTATGLEKISILVVEDHDDMRGHIRGMLESQYHVIEAANGKEGIEKARELIPDLVISDVMMPGVDGFELCRTLKNEIKTSHIPIILLTARASEASVVEGLRTGADDYIGKPFNKKMLAARIENLIDLRRQLQLKIQREKMLLPSEVTVSSQDDQFLKEFQGIIEKNIADEDFNIDVLSKKLLIGRSTLFKKIHALTGETPNQFIQSYRLERGALLLREKYGNVTEVAMAVGFSSPQYFSRCFKEKFHQSPKTYCASEEKK